jgi:glycosyltransferase involved in cell wall biosynthesis|tara:strand:+ start:22846 stop:24135 length:1290 start_codon:yes stop_codon:yes gene_type:complete
MKKEKIKILTISDHPLSPSGVGTQTKYFVESLVETGNYKFVCLGGAIKHHDYNPVKVAPYNDDWIIYPVDGYGDHEKIRSIIRNEKPDVLWFMTDPRFFTWLWEIEDEIRALMPMVYYHVWDNYPAPHFNRQFYESNDTIVTISKVTDSIVSEVAPSVERSYIPHAVDPSVFKPLEDPSDAFKNSTVVRERVFNCSYEETKDKLLFFWNNRNARRKQSGTLVWWFKDYLDEFGHDSAALLMHTDPHDQNGQDLAHLIEHLGLQNGQVMISNNKISPNDLASMYNAADCTINISDAEGFGLATLESLSCGTPIITTMTGGLQEQVTDGKNWFGIGIEPCSKAVIGSQQVPYIYEDRISNDDFLSAMRQFTNMTAAERAALGAAGREHVLQNYSFESFKEKWVATMDDIVERHGSWQNRKNYTRWRLLEVA